jgi:hypothetical protein
MVLPLACGGDDGDPGPTRAQFVSNADRICKRLRELTRPIDRRLDRTSDAQKQLSLVRSRNGYQEAALGRLQSLSAPETAREVVARYIGALEKRRQLGSRLESALEREDLPAARSILLDGVAVNRVAYHAAIRLGLRECEKGRSASARDVLDVFTPDIGVPVRVAAESTILKLTVEGVVDPLESAAASPPDGVRFVAVRLGIENVGERSIEISLAQETTLTTSKDEQLDPAFAGVGGECAESLTVATLSAGGERSGCIPFQVPEGQRAKAFQFGGFTETAEWDLTSAPPQSGAPEPSPESVQGVVE